MTWLSGKKEIYSMNNIVVVNHLESSSIQILIVYDFFMMLPYYDNISFT
jgi:hypothetical protein